MYDIIRECIKRKLCRCSGCQHNNNDYMCDIGLCHNMAYNETQLAALKEWAGLVILRIMGSNPYIR